MGALKAITGGRERLLFDMNRRAEAPPLAKRESLAHALHARTNVYDAEIVKAGGIPLRAGVLALMQQCEGRACAWAHHHDEPQQPRRFAANAAGSALGRAL